MARKRKEPGQRRGASIVLGLNLQFLFRFFFLYLFTDLLLLLLTGGGMLLWANRQCADISGLVAQRGVPSEEASVWMAAGDYTVTALDAPPAESGFVLEGIHLKLGSLLPQGDLAGSQWVLDLGDAPFFLGPWDAHPGRGVTYTVSVPNGGQPYAIALDLAQPTTVAVMGGRVLLLCQLISLLWNLLRNVGIIRRTLRPIQDLAATAARLGSAATMSPDELKVLAGKLDAINATHLDQRISVNGTQKELKALAQAINAMLERINEAYRSQMRFVSDASHELRTPISVIQGYANLLDRWGKSDPATMQESIDAIRLEADAMKDLVEQLLFLARGDNDSMPIHMVPFDLTEVAAQVLKETEMLDAAAHDLTGQWGPAPIPIQADLGLIKQCLRILVNNSLQYTPPGGRVTLAVVPEGDYARLSIQDEGQGIDAESLPHIFERFYRTDQSRARQTGGTGLGLSIAKWIVERHGGWIEVLSREGIGTRFTVVLPLVALDTQL